MRDAVLGSFAFLALVAWISVEFLGLVIFVRKLARMLGKAEENAGQESVNATLVRMYREGEIPYAATRNAEQARRKIGG